MKYGLYAIFKPDAPDVDREVRDILTRAEATVEKTETNPPAHLAYPIGKIQTGLYQWVTFSAEPRAIPAIQKALGFVSGLLRSMITSDVSAVFSAPGPAPAQSRVSQQTTTSIQHVTSRAPAMSAPKLSQEEIDKQIEEMLKDEVVK